MAGLTLAQRDLDETRERLQRWFEARGGGATVSPLRVANRAAGWSSETLRFAVDTGTGAAEFVLRIPPAGGGMFPVYDLEGQTRTQELLHRHGVATPHPITYEADETWLGARFLIMPMLVGHTPSDTSYATRGWLHGAGPEVQRRLHDSFLDTLLAIHRVPADEAPWLARPTGVGTGPELDWWRDYLDWATDNDVPAVMARGFDWLERHLPADAAPLGVSWGDARLSNTICDDSGAIIGVLDWEQGCLGPAEADLGWWLATRRQTLEVQGIDADPELPGFDSRAAVIGRYEQLLGRRLHDLGWYEMFSMLRMGCCILRTKTLLRGVAQTDHGFLTAPILPGWVVETIGEMR